MVLAEDIARYVPPTGVAVWNLGQSGIALKVAGKLILIDPHLSDSLTVASGGQRPRFYPPPVMPAQLTTVDLVLITHDHRDHLDPETLAPLSRAAPGAHLAVPRPALASLTRLDIPPARCTGMVPGLPLSCGQVFVEAWPVRHEEYDQAPDGSFPWLAYLLRAPGLTICHLGDTVAFDDLAEWLRTAAVDLLFVPINGQDWWRRRNGLRRGNMDFREAADLAVYGGVRVVVPIHWDMYAWNTERPSYFVDYITTHYPHQPFKLLARGERFVYVP